ncbi:hypothetical protein AWC32_14150 [Mycobacterium xenopi]|nr:hypothetical protein AWC32_14150 [Mycobacterium xenopi]
MLRGLVVLCGVGGGVFGEALRVGLEVCDFRVEWFLGAGQAGGDANHGGIADGAVGVGEALDLCGGLRRELRGACR